MSNTNIVVITGNLGQDPEVGESPQGIHYGSFSLANNERYKPKGSDAAKKHTNWLRVVAFNGLADSLLHLSKGDQVTVIGRLRIKTRDRDDGSKVTVVEIHAREIDFVKVKGRDADDDADGDAGQSDTGAPEDDDIPY